MRTLHTNGFGSEGEEVPANAIQQGDGLWVPLFCIFYVGPTNVGHFFDHLLRSFFQSLFGDALLYTLRMGTFLLLIAVSNLVVS